MLMVLLSPKLAWPLLHLQIRFSNCSNFMKRTGIQMMVCLYLLVFSVLLSFSMLFTKVEFLTFLLVLRVPTNFPLSLSFVFLLTASLLQCKAALSPPPAAAAVSSASPMGCSVWSFCLPALCQFSLSVIYFTRAFLIAPTALHLGCDEILLFLTL